MATITGTGLYVSRGVYVQTYSAMGDADQGSQFNSAQLQDKTVHCTGTFSSAVVTIQGSNDGTNWVTLADPQGNALTFSAAGMEVILENPLHLRPTTSGGSGADIDVVFVGN